MVVTAASHVPSCQRLTPSFLGYYSVAYTVVTRRFRPSDQRKGMHGCMDVWMYRSQKKQEAYPVDQPDDDSTWYYGIIPAPG